MMRFSSTVAIALVVAPLAATGAHGQSSAAADPRLALPPTLNSALRSEIERASTSAALEEVLARHPDQGDLLVPRIEAVATGEINSAGPGDRFAIEEMTPNDSPARSVTLRNVGRGTTVIKEFASDAFEMLGGAPGASFGAGSIHRFAGKIAFAPELSLVGEGDRDHRLTFAILATYGMVYVRGRGRIVVAIDGQEKTIELGTPQD
jgi:hypothetical protein